MIKILFKVLFFGLFLTIQAQDFISPQKNEVYYTTGTAQYCNLKNLPLQVRAKLFKKKNPETRRTDFGKTKRTTHTNRMEEMNWLVETDERGHLLASELDGPAELWNLVPQSKKQNRHQKSVYENFRRIEGQVAKFIQECKPNEINCFVQYNISVKYGDKSRPCRPTKFIMDITCNEPNKPSITKNYQFENYK